MSGSRDHRLVDALERVGHALRVQLRTCAGELGLSPMQAQILMRVASGPAAERGVARLAQWFDVSPPTVTDSVRTLERKGLVTRHPVAGDRRRSALVVTDTGRAAAERLVGWAAPVDAALAQLGPAGPDPTAWLIELIGRLQAEGVVSVARTCSTCRFFRPEAHPGEASPHHCTLLDEPLGPATVRLDCAEHSPA